jgi:hypothetical protein
MAYLSPPCVESPLTPGYWCRNARTPCGKLHSCNTTDRTRLEPDSNHEHLDLRYCKELQTFGTLARVWVEI